MLSLKHDGVKVASHQPENLKSRQLGQLIPHLRLGTESIRIVHKDKIQLSKWVKEMMTRWRMLLVKVMGVTIVVHFFYKILMPHDKPWPQSQFLAILLHNREHLSMLALGSTRHKICGLCLLNNSQIRFHVFGLDRPLQFQHNTLGISKAFIINKRKTNSRQLNTGLSSLSQCTKLPLPLQFGLQPLFQLLFDIEIESFPPKIQPCHWNYWSFQHHWSTRGCSRVHPRFS